MNIYIRLKELKGTTSFTFPANPETISATFGTKYQSFDILSKGTIQIPKGMNVSEIKWNGEFFGISKKNEAIVLREYYQTPEACILQLRKWQEEGTILNLIVTNTWINMDVTISSFTPEVYGAYGNVKYSLSFAQKKELKIYTTEEQNIQTLKKIKPRNESAATSLESGDCYTVVSGDTLWGIATKKLGSGAKWTKIYDANIETIETTAKSRGKSSSDHGHWIFPGETLTIPMT